MMCVRGVPCVQGLRWDRREGGFGLRVTWGWVELEFVVVVVVVVQQH